MSTATWQLDDPRVVNGVNTATLTTSSGVACHCEDECILDSPVDMNVEGHQQISILYTGGHCPLFDFCYEVDKWALTYLQSHSLRLFQKSLDMTQVKAISTVHS